MPLDRGTIDAQLREIGEGERWWEQREFRDLPHVLHADERIHGVVNGRLLGSRRPRLRPAGSWLIVATNQRLLCLKQAGVARKQVEIRAAEIVRIRQSNRLTSLQIVIGTTDRAYRIRIPKAQAFRFAGALAALVSRATAPTPVDMASVAWFTGVGPVPQTPGVGGIVSRFLMLSSGDPGSRERLEHLELTVERLQSQLVQLQQQVGFLEDLLQKRSEEQYLPPAPADT